VKVRDEKPGRYDAFIVMDLAGVRSSGSEVAFIDAFCFDQRRRNEVRDAAAPADAALAC
jgi:hypothetical protein